MCVNICRKAKRGDPSTCLHGLVAAHRRSLYMNPIWNFSLHFDNCALQCRVWHVMDSSATRAVPFLAPGDSLALHVFNLPQPCATGNEVGHNYMDWRHLLWEKKCWQAIWWNDLPKHKKRGGNVLCQDITSSLSCQGSKDSSMTTFIKFC